MADSSPHKDRVLAVLFHHQGRDNGISAHTLAATLDISEREVRHAISEIRLAGTAVCAHPANGYFIAVNDEEIEDTCKFLRSRALHSLELESKLRNIALPELLGQLRLKT